MYLLELVFSMGPKVGDDLGIRKLPTTALYPKGDRLYMNVRHNNTNG